MADRKNYYDNANTSDMRNFNPRFNDLYQNYSDSQHDNHTFNLNGIIYVHNHHGGEPIPVGKVKSHLDDTHSTQKERASVAGTARAGVGTAQKATANAWKATGAAQGAGANVRKTTRGAQATGGVVRNAAGGIQSRIDTQKGNSLGVRKLSTLIVFVFVLMFVIGALVPVLMFLYDEATDSGGDYKRELVERDSLPLEESIMDEGVMYLMGTYIQIGDTADTLWERFDKPEMTETVAPGGNYYASLLTEEGYGVGTVTLLNDGEEETTDIDTLVITDVSASYFVEYPENGKSRMVETDAEIINGITIGMSADDAFDALSEICESEQPERIDIEEAGQEYIYAFTEEYYYNVKADDDRVMSIGISRQPLD